MKESRKISIAKYLLNRQRFGCKIKHYPCTSLRISLRRLQATYGPVNERKLTLELMARKIFLCQSPTSEFLLSIEYGDTIGVQLWTFSPLKMCLDYSFELSTGSEMHTDDDPVVYVKWSACGRFLLVHYTVSNLESRTIVQFCLVRLPSRFEEHKLISEYQNVVAHVYMQTCIADHSSDSDSMEVYMSSERYHVMMKGRKDDVILSVKLPNELRQITLADPLKLKSSIVRKSRTITRHTDPYDFTDETFEACSKVVRYTNTVQGLIVDRCAGNAFETTRLTQRTYNQILVEDHICLAPIADQIGRRLLSDNYEQTTAWYFTAIDYHVILLSCLLKSNIYTKNGDALALHVLSQLDVTHNANDVNVKDIQRKRVNKRMKDDHRFCQKTAMKYGRKYYGYLQRHQSYQLQIDTRTVHDQIVIDRLLPFAGNPQPIIVI